MKTKGEESLLCRLVGEAERWALYFREDSALQVSETILKYLRLRASVLVCIVGIGMRRALVDGGLRADDSGALRVCHLDGMREEPFKGMVVDDPIARTSVVWQGLVS